VGQGRTHWTFTQINWDELSAQHFLNFLPLPQGHGAFRPTFGALRVTVRASASSGDVAEGLAEVEPVRRNGRRRVPMSASAWALGRPRATGCCWC
jgi:hypothetical protein